MLVFHLISETLHKTAVSTEFLILNFQWRPRDIYSVFTELDVRNVASQSGRDSQRYISRKDGHISLPPS
jgi:hypothetical protein